MSLCTLVNEVFDKYINGIDQAVEIEKDKDKKLRYNVWKTTSAEVKGLFEKGISVLPKGDEFNSQPVLSKIERALERINESDKTADVFMAQVINSDSNIEMSIALHEVMESVKGESDKARNLGIEVSAVTAHRVLPALPLSRIAASIGRKIMFQKGYRYSSAETDKKTSAEIETLYYQAGWEAIQLLDKKGYLTISDDINTIKDYINATDLKKKNPETNVVTNGDNNVMSVALNEEKFGIKADSVEAKYFLDRTESDVTDTSMGVIIDTLGAVRQITQPSTIVLPDTEVKQTAEDLAERDDQRTALDPVMAEVRKKLYDTPVYVQNTVHGFMELLNKEAFKKNKSGSKLIQDKLKAHPLLVESLFGIKRADNFSVDKKQSIKGQNLSKTTPMDDLVEHYQVLQDGSVEPGGLHLPMKKGRNDRLYYDNSVLNAHASKQSRYMLTPGDYTVDSGSVDFKYLVSQVSEAPGDGDEVDENREAEKRDVEVEEGTRDTRDIDVNEVCEYCKNHVSDDSIKSLILHGDESRIIKFCSFKCFENKNDWSKFKKKKAKRKAKKAKAAKKEVKKKAVKKEEKSPVKLSQEEQKKRKKFIKKQIKEGVATFDKVAFPLMSKEELKELAKKKDIKIPGNLSKMGTADFLYKKLHPKATKGILKEKTAKKEIVKIETRREKKKRKKRQRKRNASSNDDEEEALETLMMADVDVSDIDCEDGMITVLVPTTDFFKTKTALQEMNPDIDFEVEEITYLPTMEHPIAGDDVEQFERFAALINDLEDVQEIYHNGTFE